MESKEQGNPDLGNISFQPDNQINSNSPKADNTETFAMALIEREKKRGVKGSLPSTEKQVEYIYLTIKKQEKRYKKSLIIKWLFRIIIVLVTYYSYTHSQEILNKYIIPEVTKRITESIGVMGTGSANNQGLQDIIKNFGIPKGANISEMTPAIKKGIEQKIKETVDFYKNILQGNENN